MINYIKGTLVYKGESYIVVETGNAIGYEINVPSNSVFYLKNIGETVCVFTVLIVREDDMSLYGFDGRESLKVFGKLIGVNGIGAKAAMAIFSVMSAEEIIKAVMFEDAAAFTKANGIGKKTAQRIVIDLRDQFGDIDMASAVTSSRGSEIESLTFVSVAQEAIVALMELGYSRTEAADAVAKVGGDDLTVEDYIKKALRNI